MLTKWIKIQDAKVYVEYHIENYPDRNSYDGCGEIIDIEVDEFEAPQWLNLTFKEVTEELKKQLEYEKSDY